jgi:ubiquinol-cytochrome c reductase cytochrome b subunit
LADPTDTTYVPRPDWYFLFLFQLLKFFEGPLEVVGSVVLPGLAVLALILVPFVDRGAIVRVTRRVVAFGCVAFGAIAWASLTLAAVRTTPKPPVEIDFAGPTGWLELSPEELAGIGYFRVENCASCHNIDGGKAKAGPSLAASGTRRSAAWMIEHFKRPSTMVPGTSMPAINLTNGQLNALAAFLLKLNPKNAEALESAPDFAAEGAMVYQAHNCGVCHTVNGSGMKTGPPLNGLAKRRDRDWVVAHFADPQKLSPGTVMPPYRLSSSEMGNLVQYLFALSD